MANHKIVVADNDLDTARFLEMSLQTLDCQIIPARNGAEVLGLIAQSRPSMIISNWTLSDFSGLELLTRLKATPATKSIPFVILNDNSDDELRGAMVEIGVADYWCKPLNLLTVAASVRKILKRQPPPPPPTEQPLPPELAAMFKPRDAEIVNNRYKLLEPIGEGGMGVVYRAEDLTNNEIIALKLLRSEYINQDVEMKRFAREASAAMSIQHPNVVTTYEYEIAPNGQAYITMELLNGHSLDDELDIHETLPQWRALAIMDQVFQAVDAAHRKGIIHRDLKPSNIHLINTDAAIPTVKILDFGIAWLRSTVDMERLTGPDVVMGTPHYISPEQATGRALDERVDIYCLGIVFYELLTGRPPFEGSSMTVMMAHLNVPPAEIDDLVPLDKWLANLIMKMIEKDPANRPQSMAEILRIIEENK